MATFTDIEKERLANLYKKELRRANTLGPDGHSVEEPFGVSNIVFREDVFGVTPTAATNFASPDYGDYPVGGVATRRIEIRLHPLVTSGKTGNDSIQSFVLVSAAPASDSYQDIEAVRIKRIVPDELSMGRSHAAESNVARRGFTLALYPAQDDGAGYLEADTTNGPIPIAADPSAVGGIGENGSWYVDYANGIVRFTAPPVNGATGIMNPNNVFGNISGQTGESDSNRITMFATFYEYTGLYLNDNYMVTVGDGLTSYGTIFGDDGSGDYAPIMQQAIDSFNGNGGTVFVQPGNYVYNTEVAVPSNVKIVGLSKNAVITLGVIDAPAFKIYGSNIEISGLTFYPYSGTGGYSSLIQINATSSSETDGTHKLIENITISDNIINGNYESVGVSFYAEFDEIIARNIEISNNTFTCLGEDGLSTAIGSFPLSDTNKNFILNNIKIQGNTFNGNTDASIGEIGISLEYTAIKSIDNMIISDGYAGVVDFYISAEHDISDLYIEGTDVNSVYISAELKNNLNINDNIIRFSLNITGIGRLYQSSIRNNKGYFGLQLPEVGGIDKCVISDNFISYIECMDQYEVKIIDTNITNNQISSGFSITALTIDRMICSGNYIDAGCTIGSSRIDNSEFIDGYVDGNLVWNGGVDSTACVISSNRVIGNISVGNMSERYTVSNNDAVSIIMSSTKIKVDLLIEGNTLSSGISIESAEVNRGIISGNILGTGMDISSNLTNVSIINNIVPSISISSQMYRSAVENNQINGNALFTGDLDELKISGNSIVGYLSCTGSFDKSKLTISDNTIGSYFSIPNNTITNSIISGNYVGGYFSVPLAAMDDVNISNNIIETTTNIGSISTASTNVIVSENVCNGVSVFGKLTNSSVVGNNFNDDATIYDLITTVFSNNSVADDAGFYGPVSAQSVISGNSFLSDLYIEPMTDSSVVDNSIKYFTCKATTRVVFSGNNVLSYCYFDGAANTLSVVGNYIGSYMQIRYTATNCIISSNNLKNDSIQLPDTLTDVEITSNYAYGLQLPGSKTNNRVTISNNIITGSCSGSGSTCNYFNISDNTFSYASLATNIFTKSTISNNYFHGDFVSGALTDTSLCGNKIYGRVELGAVDGAQICNNTLFTLASGYMWLKSTVTDSVVAENDIGDSIVFDGAVSSSVISKNIVNDSIALGGTLLNVAISENKITNNLTIAGANINTVIVSKNMIGGNFQTPTNNTVEYLSIVENIITGTVAGGYAGNTYSVCNISDNVFRSTVSFVCDFTNAVIIGNTVSGTTGVSKITSVDVCNNRFVGSLTISGYALGSIISNNVFGDRLTVSTALAMPVLDRSSVCGNFLGTGIYIAHTGTGAGNEIAIDSIVSDNVCTYLSVTGNAFTSGTSSIDRCVFKGNTVGESSVLGSTASYACNIQQCIINGNFLQSLSINGYTGSQYLGTIISSNCIIGGISFSPISVSSPPASQGEPIIALNCANGYSGVIFTNGKALGWGNNLTGATISSVVGSNLDVAL